MSYFDRLDAIAAKERQAIARQTDKVAQVIDEDAMQQVREAHIAAPQQPRKGWPKGKPRGKKSAIQP